MLSADPNPALRSAWLPLRQVSGNYLCEAHSGVVRAGRSAQVCDTSPLLLWRRAVAMSGFACGSAVVNDFPDMTALLHLVDTTFPSYCNQ